MGAVLDSPSLGWGAWPWIPIPFAVIGVILMATLWNVTPKGRGGH
jgi:hypothetical protein